jgi:hypothetical protein
VGVSSGEAGLLERGLGAPEVGDEREELPLHPVLDPILMNQ